MQPHLTRPETPVKRFSTTPDAGLDRLLADPALCSTAKAVATALARRWAWRGKPECWPSDATIAKAVGRSVGHVQRCLRQLERAGWVTRERTTDVPNGRRIWLNWRRPDGAGAQPVASPARTDPPAPARDKDIVIVKQQREAVGDEKAGRLRQERSLDGPRGDRRPGAVDPAPAPLPARQVKPEAVPRGVRRVGLSLVELATAAATTADPILARELARLTAPAPAPEPDLVALPLPELLGRLPGRHDLVMATARRLCVEVGDTKPATLRTIEGMCRAVASRSVPPETLVSCSRQATGPRARHRGKVLVAAWKRDGV